MVKSNFRDSTSNNEETYKYFKKLTEYFTSSVGPIEEKLFHFSKYVSRQSLTLFLAKYELFKKILNVHGSIIAFDELNYKNFVGETKAVIDTIGIPNLKIQRFSFNINMSYAILEKKGNDLI